MRHQKARSRLSRNSSLRKATLRDLAKATLIQQRICTTIAKAKEARKLVDRLITLGKKGTLAAKRKAFSVLCDHQLVSKLFNSIAGRFNLRAGGYTRVIPMSNRRGDNAQLAFLELTEKDQIIVSKTRSAAQGQSQSKQLAAADGAGKKVVFSKSKSESTSIPEEGKKEKIKSTPKIIGGLKKMFTKKPSSGS